MRKRIRTVNPLRNLREKLRDQLVFTSNVNLNLFGEIQDSLYYPLLIDINWKVIEILQDELSINTKQEIYVNF